MGIRSNNSNLNPRLLCVGGAHMDRIGTVHQPVALARSNPGRFVEMPGGAAFNTACIASAMGATTTLFSVVAEDDNGIVIRATAEQREVVLLGPTVEQTPSYTAIVEQDGTLVVALADMDAYGTMEAEGAVAEARKLLPHDIMFLDANLPVNVLEQLVKKAPCKIAMTTTSAAKALRLKTIYNHASVLFSNAAEMEALFGSLDEGMRAIEISDIRAAVFSDGANPLHLFDATAPSPSWSQLDVVPVPAHSIVDVIGAGDALAGGTIAGLMAGSGLGESVTLGMGAAQLVLSTRGPYCEGVKELKKANSLAARL